MLDLNAGSARRKKIQRSVNMLLLVRNQYHLQGEKSAYTSFFNRLFRSKAALESMIDDDDETMCQTSKMYRANSKSRSRSVSPKPSCSKTQEWKEKSAEAEQLLFGEDSQTPNVSDSEMMQAPNTAECNRKWGRKPKGFIGNIPHDTQGKRINEKIDFGKGSTDCY